MKQGPYTSLDALDEAITAKQVDNTRLRAYFDGGEVIINNEKGETLYQADMQQTLIELLDVWMGITHENI